jgi:hypothetical protein
MDVRRVRSEEAGLSPAQVILAVLVLGVVALVLTVAIRRVGL